MDTTKETNAVNVSEIEEVTFEEYTADDETFYVMQER